MQAIKKVSEADLKWRGNPSGRLCPECGIDYDDFRTGLTYQDVYDMLWRGSEDSSQWRYKRRGTILGKWYQIKKEMWENHTENCNGVRPDIIEVEFSVDYDEAPIPF